jgi:hypothetical protein
MSESRLRSLKRRFVVLKNGRLDFYRTAKNQMRNEPPATTIPLENIHSITRVSTKSGTQGLQISTPHETLRYHAENDNSTEQWFNCINHALRQLTINELAHRTQPSDAILSGWIIKVKHGHPRRYFAALLQQKLLFFKKEDDKVPCSQIFLQGSRVCEKARESSDEYSGSSDEAPSEIPSANRSSAASSNQQQTVDYCICIEGSNVDPLYLMLKNGEEKDKWLYYLRLASKDPSICGTPFEVLIQRLMVEPNPLGRLLNNDVV